MNCFYSIKKASCPVTRIAGIPLASLLLALVVFPMMSLAAEADQGKQLFLMRCTGCHSLDRNREGPNLASVYGRQAGTSPITNIQRL